MGDDVRLLLRQLQGVKLRTAALLLGVSALEAAAVPKPTPRAGDGSP